MTSSPRIAIAHDYLSTPGGAERVVEVLAEQFPDALIFTSVFEPHHYPTIDPLRVRTSWLNAIPLLRRHYRAALPLLPSAFRRLRVTAADADVVLCSTSGWAHGISSDVPKIAYCHNPARWLYQPNDYFRGRPLLRLALSPLMAWLRRFDQRAAASCAHYFGNSSAVASRITQAYGRSADVLWPPSSFNADGPQAPVDVSEPFFLSVGRLLPYKRVTEMMQAFTELPNHQLVVVGDGPLRATLAAQAPDNVTLLGQVDEPTLRWLYHHATALVSASSEDFGLTPVEAAACGTPSVLLRGGGFLDTCIEGVNGLFFDEPTPSHIARAVETAASIAWNGKAIRGTADRFGTRSFAMALSTAASANLRR